MFSIMNVCLPSTPDGQKDHGTGILACVSVHVRLSVYVCMCVCIIECVHVLVRVHVEYYECVLTYLPSTLEELKDHGTGILACMSVHVRLSVCTCVCVCVCVCVCTCVRMYVCVHN
jgi:hypothetical protein